VPSRGGITKRIGWHNVSQNVLQLLRATGAELKVMQELMRHSTIRVTLETYTQAVTNREACCANRAVISLFVTNKKKRTAA
jgi:site-specific recombinase XerD